MSTPSCPICFERLGAHGGPTTLPCGFIALFCLSVKLCTTPVGHNGCLQCLEQVQLVRAECPLCRFPFHQNMKLSLNLELRDLIQRAFRNEENLKVLNDTSIQADVTASAPPLEAQNLQLEALSPPAWMPDSCSDTCLDCGIEFFPIIRSRHHCRLCGGLFCDSCSNKRRLFPLHFSFGKTMQRACNRCAEVLDPFQDTLIRQSSAANALPVNDTFDWKSARSWINSPYSGSIEEDIYKCTNIIKTLFELSKQSVFPVLTTLMKDAEGIAILSEVKVAVGILSVRLGTGLVLSKKSNGREWGAPSSIGSVALGTGLQVGTQLMDVVIFLPDKSAVAAFTGDIYITVNGTANACFGVGIGIQQSFSFQVHNSKEIHTCICPGFAFCRGAFLGTALETSILTSRTSLNHLFYGYPVSTKQLLLEHTVPSPRAVATLYQHLNQLLAQ